MLSCFISYNKKNTNLLECNAIPEVQCAPSNGNLILKSYFCALFDFIPDDNEYF